MPVVGTALDGWVEPLGRAGKNVVSDAVTLPTAELLDAAIDPLRTFPPAAVYDPFWPEADRRSRI
jgi:hypothetical protein